VRDPARWCLPDALLPGVHRPQVVNPTWGRQAPRLEVQCPQDPGVDGPHTKERKKPSKEGGNALKDQTVDSGAKDRDRDPYAEARARARSGDDGTAGPESIRGAVESLVRELTS
jgi:hypothetical protein